MSEKNIVKIKESEIIQAAEASMDSFFELFVRSIQESVGNELNLETMQRLSSDQITLWAYAILREEVMEGGFIQLIHNGYGPFIFLNPFAKALRLWGLKDLQKLVYKGRKLFELYGEDISKDCSDEEFMALFEQFPQFDDLDDEFVVEEEQYTAMIAAYIDEHIENFAEIVK